MSETAGSGLQGGDTDTGLDQPERVLTQEEIDSLLGFSSGGDGEPSGLSGVQRVISSSLISYERLPMLEIVYDRLVRIMSTSLRKLTSDNVEVSIGEVVSLRFGDFLNAIPLPAMLAVFKAEQWDNYGLMVIDGAMIYSIVDVLLGSRRGATPLRIEGRPYTTIERGLVERLVRVILADLTASFEPLCEVDFVFERLEMNPRFASITRASNAAVLARFRIEMEDRGGRIELLIPYATLEPVRELLLQQFVGEKFGRDSIWERHLAEELWHTEVELKAVLDEQELPLSTVKNLQRGSTLQLATAPGNPVRLQCGTASLFQARLGRKRGNLAVRIESPALALRASGKESD